MPDNYLKYSLSSLFIETIMMETIIPQNSSFLKILITLLIYVSFGTALVFLYNKYKYVHHNINKIARNLFIALFIWNCINIVRSVIYSQGALLSAFGNPYTCFSLLIPIVFFFGLFENNLKIFRQVLIYYILFGILFSFVAIPFLILKNSFFTSLYTVLFLGTFFFLPAIINEKKNIKWLIILSTLIYIKYVIPDSRATILRDILLLLVGLSIFLMKKIDKKIILSISFAFLFLPFYLLYSSITSEVDVFETLSQGNKSSISDDTRSFLYREVTADLISTNHLLVGKGANSTYFSQYFNENGGDTDTRLTVEVGFLAILLKGGIVAVILNISLFIYAIKLSFFNSKNYYVIAVGYILLIHVILLFVENLVSYSIYNFIIWFCVGLCFNTNFRSLTNKQVNKILYA